MPTNKESALASISLFEKLPASVLERIAAVTGLQRFDKGTLLFRQGERAHYVHGVVSGQVALFATVAGEETVIDFFGPGEVLLIPPALLGLPYMLSARSTTEGVVTLFPAADFRGLVESEGAFATACARLLARHWRILVAHMKQIKTQDASSRFVHYLLENAKANAGRAYVILPGSKKQIANHLGITPETLSRVLRNLRKHGVNVDGQTVTVQSIARLQKLASVDADAVRPSDIN